MSTNAKFGLIVYPKNIRNERDKAMLYIRITVDGLRSEMSLKEKVLSEQWDKKAQKLKGKSVEVLSVNEHISNVLVKIRQDYRRLIELNEAVTADLLRDRYLGIQTSQKQHTLPELLTYFDKIWRGKLKRGGFKNYQTTISYIDRFIKTNHSGKTVFLSRVNMEFATDLEYFIRTNPQKDYDPCKGNGLGKHMQRFKRILNWATLDLNWLQTNPCSRYKAPLKKSKRRKMTLQDLLALEKQKFVDPNLQYIADIFTFSCYTGLAFSDLLALSPSHLEYDLNGILWCRLYRLKSDEFCRVPVLKKASAILTKYWIQKAGADLPIFRNLSNQHVNRCLKIIQEICSIDTPLTFHVARHTFARTVALKNGVPLETVQLMLGHSKITTTQIYADVDEEKIMTDMSRMEKILETKTGISMQ